MNMTNKINYLSPISQNKMNSLLEEYEHSNFQYKDENFSQTSYSFISKMTSSINIPNNIKGRLSLHSILISLAKIFMLNEYELTLLACGLEKCSWNVNQVVSKEEENYLLEFPYFEIQTDITEESRRLIIYLLVLTFTLKNSLSDGHLMEEIQAYCEKICLNFHQIVNKSAKSFSGLISNLTSSVISRKFNELSRRESQSQFSKASKDYNAIADCILKLTGNHFPQNKPHKGHNSKSSHEKSSHYQASEIMEEEDETYLSNESVKGESEYSFSESSLNVKRTSCSQLSDEEIEESANKKKVKPNSIIDFQTQDSDEFYIGSATKTFSTLDSNIALLEPAEFLNSEEFSKHSSDMFSQIREDLSHFENFDIDAVIFDEQHNVEWHF